MKLAKIYAVEQQMKALDEQRRILKMEALEEMKNSKRDRVEFENHTAIIKNIRGTDVLVVKRSAK